MFQFCKRCKKGCEGGANVGTSSRSGTKSSRLSKNFPVDRLLAGLTNKTQTCASGSTTQHVFACVRNHIAMARDAAGTSDHISILKHIFVG